MKRIRFLLKDMLSLALIMVILIGVVGAVAEPESESDLDSSHPIIEETESDVYALYGSAFARVCADEEEPGEPEVLTLKLGRRIEGEAVAQEIVLEDTPYLYYWTIEVSGEEYALNSSDQALQKTAEHRLQIPKKAMDNEEEVVLDVVLHYTRDNQSKNAKILTLRLVDDPNASPKAIHLCAAYVTEEGKDGSVEGPGNNDDKKQEAEVESGDVEAQEAESENSENKAQDTDAGTGDGTQTGDVDVESAIMPEEELLPEVRLEATLEDGESGTLPETLPVRETEFHVYAQMPVEARPTVQDQNEEHRGNETSKKPTSKQKKQHPVAWEKIGVYIGVDGGVPEPIALEGDAADSRAFSLRVMPDVSYEISVGYEGRDEPLLMQTFRAEELKPIAMNASGAGAWINIESLQRALAVHGAAQPGETLKVTVQFGDNAQDFEAQVDADGYWRVGLPNELLDALRDVPEGMLSAKAEYMIYGQPYASSGILLELPVDTKAPEITLLPEQGQSVLIEDGVLIVPTSLKGEVALRVEAEDGGTLTVDGQAAEADVRLGGEQLEDGASIRFEYLDGAGNRSEQVLTLRRIAPIEITEPAISETLGAEIREGLSLSGTMEPGETAIGQLIVDDEAQLPEEITSNEQGVWAWDPTLPEIDPQIHKLDVRLFYANMEQLGTMEAEYQVDLLPPAMPSVSARDANGNRLVSDEGDALWFNDEIDVELTLVSDADATIYMQRSDGHEETIRDQGTVIRGGSLKDGEALTFWAADDFGNSSERLIMRAQRAEPVHIVPNAPLSFGPNRPLRLSGTAQPGWMLQFTIKPNNVQGVTLKNMAVLVDDAGTWTAEISTRMIENQGTLEDLQDASLSSLEVNYIGCKKDAAIAECIYDDAVEIEVDALLVGDTIISGRTDPWAHISVDREDGGSQGKPYVVVADDKGVFKCFIEDATRLGERFEVNVTDECDNTASLSIAAAGVDNIAAPSVQTRVSGKKIEFYGKAQYGYDLELTDEAGNVLDTSPVSTQGDYVLGCEVTQDGQYAFIVRYAGLADETQTRTTVLVDTKPPVIEAYPDRIMDVAASLDVKLSEAAQVVLESENGVRLLEADVAEGNVEVSLEGIALEDYPELVLSAVDKGGNRSELYRISVAKSPDAIALIQAPPASADLDCTRKYAIEGWIIYNGEAPEVKLVLEPSQSPVELVLTRDDALLESLKSEANAYTRLDNAGCWRFSATVDMKPVPLGELRAELKLANGSIMPAAWIEGAALDVQWQVVRDDAAVKQHIAVTAALAVAFLAIVGLIYLTIVKLRRLKEANIDEKSRNSFLTIKRQG